MRQYDWTALPQASFSGDTWQSWQLCNGGQQPVLFDMSSSVKGSIATTTQPLLEPDIAETTIGGAALETPCPKEFTFTHGSLHFTQMS
jgi:hypothetical protein